MLIIRGSTYFDRIRSAEKRYHPTHQAMAHIKTILNELDADYRDVCKIMTVYKGGCCLEFGENG